LPRLIQQQKNELHSGRGALRKNQTFSIEYNLTIKTKTMKIIIAAGTGFLGKNLEQYFLKKNYEVKILTRNPKR